MHQDQTIQQFEKFKNVINQTRGSTPDMLTCLTQLYKVDEI